MKLKIRYMQAKAEKAEETTDYLDLLNIRVEPGDEENDPLFMWVKPAQLEDAQGNPNPHVVSVTRDLDIDVERVICEEVISSSSSSDGDSFE